jgi:hypothetical protein
MTNASLTERLAILSTPFFGLADEAGQMLGRTRGRERAGQREHHGLAFAEQLVRGHFLHAVLGHGLELHGRDLVADFDGHGCGSLGFLELG